MEKQHFIKEWRKHRGLTQDQLAERIGVSPAVLSRIESGRQRYNQDMLEAIGRVLTCAPADLIGRDPTDAAAATWATLTPGERVAVTQVAKTFLDRRES